MENFEIIIGALTTVVSSILTYFFTRKKYNKEIENENIKNCDDALDFYTKVCEDHKQRLDELQKEIKELRNYISKLECEIEQMKPQRCFNTLCKKRILQME